MKRFLWALMGLFVSMVTLAAPVSKGKALDMAQQFMLNRGMMNINESLSAVGSRQNAPTNGAQPYYVFSSGEGRGYVIVAGDDRADAILGYSKSSTFDESNMPENMKAWLENIEAEMRWLMAHEDVDGSVHSPYHAKEKPAIATMLSTQWDQTAPYNDLCPLDGGTRSASGCVATAMAQVMNYHKWPASTTQEIPAYQTSTKNIDMPALPITTFDWSKMKNKYSMWSDGSEVAKLMLYVGQSVKMDYTSESSGAVTPEVVTALKNYFDYDKNVYEASRSFYTIAEWDDLIYNELANNRPVMYSGISLSGGHAFVCDGYDGNGFYHINWGWGGYYDDYYKLSVLNPNSTTGVGAGSSPDGFANEQTAIIGFQKPTGEPVVERVNPPLLFTLSSAGNKFEAYFENEYFKTCKWNCALALEDENGQWDVFVQKVITLFGGNFASDRVYLPINQAIKEPGTYKVVALWRELDNDSTWHRAGQPYFYIDVKAEEKDGVLKYECTDHPIVDLKAEEITPVGRIKTGWNELKVKLVNNGDEYNGVLAIYTSENVNYEEVPPGALTVGLEPNSVNEVTMYYKVNSTSNLVIRILDSFQDAFTEIGRLTFEDYDLDISDYEVTYNPLVVKVKIHNYSKADYNRTLRALLFNDKKKQVAKLDKTQLIPVGEDVEFVYDTFNLKDPTNYYMRFQFQKSDIDGTFVTIDGQVDIEGENVGIEELTIDGTQDATWFTPSGVRVESPQGRGIFIRNGKKVVR
ncbi:MAG: C10 family peptidase [Prevotella sp.]|nr:C10 family peptidase [Prevotella sp.]